MEMNEIYFWFQLTNTKIINLDCLPKNGRSKIQNVIILLILWQHYPTFVTDAYHKHVTTYWYHVPGEYSAANALCY